MKVLVVHGLIHLQHQNNFLIIHELYPMLQDLHLLNIVLQLIYHPDFHLQYINEEFLQPTRKIVTVSLIADSFIQLYYFW